MRFFKFAVLCIALAGVFQLWQAYSGWTAGWEDFALRFPAHTALTPTGDMFSFSTMKVYYPAGRAPQRYVASLNITLSRNGLYLGPVWPGGTPALIPYGSFTFARTEAGYSYLDIKIDKDTVQLAFPDTVYSALKEKMESARQAEQNRSSGSGFVSLD